MTTSAHNPGEKCAGLTHPLTISLDTPTAIDSLTKERLKYLRGDPAREAKATRSVKTHNNIR
jgi:hypothetical protein